MQSVRVGKMRVCQPEFLNLLIHDVREQVKLRPVRIRRIRIPGSRDDRFGQHVGRIVSRRQHQSVQNLAYRNLFADLKSHQRGIRRSRADRGRTCRQDLIGRQVIECQGGSHDFGHTGRINHPVRIRRNHFFAFCPVINEVGLAFHVRKLRKLNLLLSDIRQYRGREKKDGGQYYGHDTGRSPAGIACCKKKVHAVSLIIGIIFFGTIG